MSKQTYTVVDASQCAVCTEHGRGVDPIPLCDEHGAEWDRAYQQTAAHTIEQFEIALHDALGPSLTWLDVRLARIAMWWHRMKARL